jgi:hypothetical protein
MSALLDSRRGRRAFFKGIWLADRRRGIDVDSRPVWR